MSTPLPQVAIIGSKGRMGQTLCNLSVEEGFAGFVGVDQGVPLAPAIESAAVVIDFSFHEITTQVAELCAASGRPLVIGTTGHTEAEEATISALAQKIAIVKAPNFSVGVNTLFWLTRKAAEILGPNFDLEVVEMHHGLKRDAPSGTAKRLAEILCEVRELQYNHHVKHGREGLIGQRPRAEIGMHALRGGDVVGDHTVMFATSGERVELSHFASSRETFARGALRAAHWALESKTPGLFNMEHVLGLK